MIDSGPIWCALTVMALYAVLTLVRHVMERKGRW
jgi:hypothetical protein